MQFDLRMITVEPAMFLSQMATFIQYPSLQALYYTKVCNRDFNATICENIHNATYKAEEHIVQAETSSWILYHNLTFSIPAMIVAIFMGSWSDHISRRLPLILPIIGYILSNAVLILNSVYLDWPIGLCLLAGVFGSMFGGFVLFLGSVFSYVGHIASDENRTTRIAILESMLFLGGMFGSIFGGMMVDDLGFIATFSFTLAINVLVIIFLLAWVPDIKMEDSETEASSCNRYFNWHYFLESCMVVFVRRPGNGRQRILMLVLLLAILFLTTEGAMDIAFLFLKHPPLSWSQTLFGVYSGVSLALKGLLLLTLVPILRKLFKLQDTTFMVVGLLSKMCGLVLLGFSVNTWMGMLSPVVGMLQGWPGPCTRAMLSAHVSKGEQGKIFAVTSSMQAAITLISAAIFNSLYPLTLYVFPGLMFLVAGSMLVFPILITIFIRIDLNRETNSDEFQNIVGAEDGMGEVDD